MSNQFSTLYEKYESCEQTKVSSKQLLKKLKYVKENYYCTFSPEAKEKMWELKIQIILALGLKSKTTYKDFISHEKMCKKESKRNKKNFEKDRKKRKRQKKQEIRKIREEEERCRAKVEWERRRADAEREEQERCRAKAEWERRRTEAERKEQERKMIEDQMLIYSGGKINKDIREFYKIPTKVGWKILSKKYHPDRGGDNETQQLINNIWDNFKDRY